MLCKHNPRMPAPGDSADLKSKIEHIKNQRIVLSFLDLISAKTNSNVELNKVLSENQSLDNTAVDAERKINGILELSLQNKQNETLKLLVDSKLRAVKNDPIFKKWKKINLHCNLIQNQRLDDDCKQRLFDLISKYKKTRTEGESTEQVNPAPQRLQNWLERMMRHADSKAVPKETRSRLRLPNKARLSKSPFAKLPKRKSEMSDKSVISESLFGPDESKMLEDLKEIEMSLYRSRNSSQMGSVRESIFGADDEPGESRRDSMMQSINESIFSSLSRKQKSKMKKSNFQSKNSVSNQKISNFNPKKMNMLRPSRPRQEPKTSGAIPKEPQNLREIQIDSQELISAKNRVSPEVHSFKVERTPDFLENRPASESQIERKDAFMREGGFRGRLDIEPNAGASRDLIKAEMSLFKQEILSLLESHFDRAMLTEHRQTNALICKLSSLEQMISKLDGKRPVGHVRAVKAVSEKLPMKPVKHYLEDKSQINARNDRDSLDVEKLENKVHFEKKKLGNLFRKVAKSKSRYLEIVSRAGSGDLSNDQFNQNEILSNLSGVQKGFLTGKSSVSWQSSLCSESCI